MKSRRRVSREDEDRKACFKRRMKTGRRVSREDEDRKACFKRRMKTGRRVSRGGIRPEGVFQEEDEENPNSARARCLPTCLR